MIMSVIKPIINKKHNIYIHLNTLAALLCQ